MTNERSDKHQPGERTPWWTIDPESLPAESALRIMLSYVGRPPAPCPLNTEFGEEISLPRYRRIRIRYLSEPGQWIPAYLLVPHQIHGKTPALVALHQHNLQFHLGKNEVCGLAGKPQQAYAHELAERGYVVLAADAPAFEERAIPGVEGVENQAQWARNERARGFTLGGRGIWDITRGVDLLHSLDYVDTRRIASIGHSMGAWMTTYAMALEPRLKIGLINCGWHDLVPQGPYFGLIDRPVTNPPDESLSRARIVGDLICPRPFLIISTTLDQDPQAVRRDYELARERYMAAGAGDRLELWIPEGRHRFLDEVRPRAYEWLERQLRSDGGE